MAQPVVVALVCSTLVFIHFAATLGSKMMKVRKSKLDFVAKT